MSWHKAALATEVDWVGWRISVSSWTISVPPEKLHKILRQVRSISKDSKISVKDLQSLIGRLLWLTSAWHYLRPLLIPLYRVLHQIRTTMVGMDHVIFQQFLSGLSPQLALMHDLSHKHQSPCQHVKLVRVANSNVRTLEEVYKSYLKSRRVWVGITYPSSPHRMFDAEAPTKLFRFGRGCWSLLHFPCLCHQPCISR